MAPTSWAGLLLAAAAVAVAAGDSALHVKWRERGCIYQVLTDRGFAPEGEAPPCDDLTGYCGGAYAPLARGLAYITEELGCDAVWISPVVEQVAGGYHGYWAQDFNSLNPHFGTAADLRHLKEAMEAKDVLLMVDAVFNHVGPVGMDFGRLASPFDSEAAFHARCQIEDWSNQQQVEQCRLADLPDIKQEDAGIRRFLKDWARNATGGTYGLVGTGVVADGLRIDTVPEVHPSFWREVADETGAFLAGEVFNGDAAYVASYQREALPSVLNYPAFFALRACFGPERRSLRSLEAFLGPSGELWRAFPDPHALVTFVDNHDNERWLHTGDAVGYANALAVQLLMAGIPCVYYGSEQGLAGGADPKNREPLWTTGYKTDSDLFRLIAALVAHRKAARVFDFAQIQRYADDSFYAFTRGATFVAACNDGGAARRRITYHEYAEGATLCDVLAPDSCVRVEGGGFDVACREGGPVVLYPTPVSTVE